MITFNPIRIIKDARAVLQGNDMGVFTKPGPHQYPHQWNWDSALIALGLSYFDLPRALVEINALLSGQWDDGMLPHVVYHDNPSDYFPTPKFWGIEKSPYAPKVLTSGITQPPILATVVRIMHEREQGQIEEFIKEIYPRLLAWHRWFHTNRDADGSGLVCIIHPWESGTDDSPRWLKILGTIQPETVIEFSRGDTRYVAARERPYPEDYQRFIYLIELFRELEYNQKEILAKSPFVVQDVHLNAILYQANRDLKILGQIAGEDTSEINRWIERMKANFNNRFWDGVDGLYYDFDVVKQEAIQVNTGTTFMPLFAELASTKQAERLIKDYYRQPALYEVDENINYKLTSTSKSSPYWDPRRYWRGPVWILLNWLIYQGLQNYSYAFEAKSLRDDSLSLIEKSGYREYYDPRDGSGCGSESFSWSAALALDWLERAN